MRHYIRCGTNDARQRAVDLRKTAMVLLPIGRSRRIPIIALALALVPKFVSASDATTYAELTFLASPRALPAGAITEDWPHFLGPHHNATTNETKLLKQWP